MREPVASTSASWRSRSSATSVLPPTSAPKTNSTPSSTSCCTRRSTSHFSILNSGTPKRTSPPAASSRSYTVTCSPARASCCAQAPGPAGPGADHADAATGALRGRLRHDPAFVPRAIDDRDLDLLDRHRVAFVDLEHACGLARRRAQAAGELREVVRPVQLLDRLLPAVAIDEVVPVRDQVPERAAVVAERDAALHAARPLCSWRLGERQRADEFVEVADARSFGSRSGACRRGRTLDERPDLAHQAGYGGPPTRS